MKNYLVYLAGPITGTSYDEATNWRDVASVKLNSNIQGISPMRGKQYLAGKEFIQDAHAEYTMSTPKAIVCRDRFDATRCDVLLVNFVGAKRVSIGTVLEIAWADSQRIPIVIAMEKDNVHQHAMIKEMAGYVVETLDEAVDVVNKILS